ncbi:uncharacterized protein LOC143510033 isoform X2 [Brachyhypopomus gauderio]|uniref:uncharacterized protein LOC143510033 isoform X2 n=1 Tax=Brachyhypopomus gauderio TaxID=698409 RepID=UPI004042C6D5
MCRITWISTSSDTSWALSACCSLRSLNLSGALNVSSAALCSLLGNLPTLRSLCLAGTLSDRTVMLTVAWKCPVLEHLDVSRCPHLSPAALLPLPHRGQQGGGLKRLTSLLALDVGLGEGEGEGAASGAFLLLGLPSLRRLALDGAGRACELIRNRAFGLTEGFSAQEGVPGLGELWSERVRAGDRDAETGERSDGEESVPLEEIADGWLRLDDSDLKTEEEGGRDGKTVCGRRAGAGESTARGGGGGVFGDEGEGIKLRLREIDGVSLPNLDAVTQLCPDLCSISLNCHREDDEGEEGPGQAEVLTRGLAASGGQLRCLSLQFPGGLSELVPALQAAGSQLHSLSLEGVRADGHLAFLELLRACPKLATLTVHVDPPRSNQEEEVDDEGEDDPGFPRLPHLCALTMNFSLDERQLRPVLCWRSLKGALRALLRGAPHLHTLSLTAAPCPLDPVFQQVLDRRGDSHEAPLQCLRRVSLRRSDVTMAGMVRLVNSCYRLSTLDVSGCWSMTLSNIKKLQNRASRRRHKLKIIWT